MPLAPEDKMALREYIGGVRTGIERTNVLLEEIRDLLKSPPVTVSGRTMPEPVCTCGKSFSMCPVHRE